MMVTEVLSKINDNPMYSPTGSTHREKPKMTEKGLSGIILMVSDACTEIFFREYQSVPRHQVLTNN